MSSVGKLSLEGPNLDKAREVETEGVLTELVRAGLFEFSKSVKEKDAGTNEQLSERAILMGKRIQKRILEKLNIDTLGKYIKAIRKANKYEEVEVARKVKIAREVFSQIEHDQMKFYDLSPQKAANLFEFLGLNLDLVLDFIKKYESTINESQVYSSFYRTKTTLDQGEDRTVGSEILLTTKTEAIDTFLREFVKELQNRGIA